MAEASFMIRERQVPPDAIDRPFVDLALTPQGLSLGFIRRMSGGDLMRLTFAPPVMDPICSCLIRIG